MIRALTFVTATLLVAACASEPPRQMAGPALPPAPLPTYAIGDQVTWSNGQTETVVAIDGEVVSWRDQDGNTFSGYRNFTLPSLAWDYPKSTATTEMAIPATTLWPLKLGNEADFKVSQRLTLKIHDSDLAYHDEWGCRVDGTERVSVALGKFDTFKLRCKRFWQGSNIGEITWNYAPALGRVVKRNWTGAKEPEELIAMGSGKLGPKAETVAAKVRQHGLEKMVSGSGAMGRAAGIQAQIVPKATFTTSTGAICRDFLQTLETKTARATTAGIACRAKDGKWTVVDRIKATED
ncbi:MAG: hypothetical protein H7Z12_01970 [Rhodospirillaceae bacterium]|nr:hypothetical protein [Rhodospirillales bacterium]